MAGWRYYAIDGCHGIKISGKSYARFTLADPMPRLASDVVRGKWGRNHLMSRRDPIHIGRMAHNAYIRVGWYHAIPGSCKILYDSLVGTVKESYLQLSVALYTFGSRLAGGIGQYQTCLILPNDLPMVFR